MPPNKAAFLDNLLSGTLLSATVLACAALALLGARAFLRIEVRWDAFAYHIPFAAKRAGLPVPFEVSDALRPYYEGFPPLPEFLEGLLWRATGSLEAVGTINIIALGLFLYHCYRNLKASFAVTTLLALTAPLVIIHAATAYIDLFGNALLAIGVSSLFAMLLFDRWTDRSLLCWGLAGLAGAAWSKTILLPIVVVSFACYVAVGIWRFRDGAVDRRLLLVASAMVLASIPYAKNVILYRNPVWPLRSPVWDSHFPYTLDSQLVKIENTPPPLIGLSQPALFRRSILEIDHPTWYPNRPRWVIDQGNAWIAFRSGGFWYAAVITAIVSAVLLGFLFKTQKGWLLLAALAAMWLGASFLPVSHQLRFYIFLPLTMAAIIGMLLPQIRNGYPAVALVLLAIFLGEFVWMADVNRAYYAPERIHYRDAAEAWGMTRYWKQLQRGQTYCAVAFKPSAFFLTGPTMTEFHIIDRDKATECPPNVTVILASNSAPTQ